MLSRSLGLGVLGLVLVASLCAASATPPAVDTYSLVERTVQDREKAWSALGLTVVSQTTTTVAGPPPAVPPPAVPPPPSPPAAAPNTAPTFESAVPQGTPVPPAAAATAQTPAAAPPPVNEDLPTATANLADDIDVSAMAAQTGPPVEPTRSSAEDKVGGIGGQGSGEGASAQQLADLYDAKTSKELTDLISKTFAAYKVQQPDPFTVRPIYAAKDVVNQAYRDFTGKQNVEVCKGDLVQEAIFESVVGCMSKFLINFDPKGKPQHAGIPVLRRRTTTEPCFYASVRCLAPKTIMLTPEALVAQIEEQLKPRVGGQQYSARTFAKREVVNAAYPLFYKKVNPDKTPPPMQDVCGNRGPNEFSGEYNVGTWQAIFANDVSCLPGQTPNGAVKCNRIAVECIGKPPPETIAAMKALDEEQKKKEAAAKGATQ